MAVDDLMGELREVHLTQSSMTSLPAATLSSVVMSPASRANGPRSAPAIASRDFVACTVRCIRSIGICSFESGLRSSCDVMDRNTFAMFDGGLGHPVETGALERQGCSARKLHGEVVSSSENRAASSDRPS